MEDDSRIRIEGLKPADVALLKDVAEAAVEQAVNERLIAMGLDPDNPRSMQADMVWLRSRREWSEKGMWHAATVIITLLIGTLGVWIWTGFKAGVK